MILENKTKGIKTQIEIARAETLFARMRGLLGTPSLSENRGLWISSCNSIHTFFMKYPIDCVFVDKALVVKAIKSDIVPFRMTLPVFGADSVFELSAGTAKRVNIDVGDKLYVGN